MNRSLLVVLITASLAACGQGNQDAPAATAPVADTAPAPVPEAPAAAQPKYLSFSEDAVDLCRHPGGQMATTISWDASSVPTEGVEVWLENPGEPRQLWAQAAAVGTGTTGEWIRKGTTVTLVNGSDKQTLETFVVQETPCTTAN